MADEMRMARTHTTGNGETIPRDTRVTPADRAASEAGLADLLRQLAQDSAMLVRQEVTLAKAELQQNLKSAVRDATMVAVGGGVALVGALVMVLFLVLAVGDAVNEYWLGALIVGAILLLAGGLLAKGSLRKLKSGGIAPERTLETLKEDKQWAQNEIRQVRRDLA
jgi:uncharacterized membrane protein YqjE